MIEPEPPTPPSVRTSVRPNLVSYDEARRTFSWDAARAERDGLPNGAGLNSAHAAVDRHAAGPAGARTALRWLGRDGSRLDLTYAELARSSSRFANVLRTLGVEQGERVFALAGRVPDLYVAALGTVKAGCVFSPLFSAFGPEPIRTRLGLGSAKVLVTTAALYDRKVATIRDQLPELRHVLLVGERAAPASGAGTQGLVDLLERASDRFAIPPTRPEDPALLHYTSGTTGTPKGALHVHEAVVCHHVTGKLALDFQPGDVFWCTADPGWVTGTSYGIIAPLTNGITMVVDEADFDLERWYRILAEERVTIWYTAPTAVRMLMRGGLEPLAGRAFPHLRFIASVGEPLHAEGVLWGEKAFGLPIHDNWWQTETGGIMIANYAGMQVKPGSMGRPLPGVDAAIVHRTGDDDLEVVDEPGVEGELALRAGWPSMFRAYLGQEERYRKCFRKGWYLTGDLARRDADGYYWFVGRADDVIKSAGHLIGPFEVESVLMAHPAVADVCVIGVPDAIAGEVVKAFVALHPSHVLGPDLERSILAHARRRLGPVVAPKYLAFVESIPHTRSGKILRRLVKARELGLPEGDLSTLEGAA